MIHNLDEVPRRTEEVINHDIERLTRTIDIHVARNYIPLDDYVRKLAYWEEKLCSVCGEPDVAENRAKLLDVIREIAEARRQAQR